MCCTFWPGWPPPPQKLGVRGGWAFFWAFLKIGVFNLGVFFSFSRNWRFFLGVFNLGVFFFVFQKLAFFSWRFFGRFFVLPFFLDIFWIVSFLKFTSSKKKRFFGRFLWAFFFDEFRKLAFFGRFYFGFFFIFEAFFFGVFWAFFSKNKKNASLTTIRLGQKKLHFSKPVQHFFGRAPFFFLKCYV